MSMSDFLVILGIFVFSQALRTTQSPLLHKLGIFGHIVTSFLLGWFLSETWWVGLVFASFWFVWPWYELITRVRKITMPQEKNLRHKSPPHPEFFPALDELTSDIESEGFEHVEDLGRDWEEAQQFFRVFHKPDERCQAVICLVEQGRFAFYYLRITSRSADGRVWMTWNYPFSLNLQFASAWAINREAGERTFIQLLDSHRMFLEVHGIPAGDLTSAEPEKMLDDIQNEQQDQIAHNLTAGILARQADGAIRYTWRGLFFIWLQFLRDFVRLS